MLHRLKFDGTCKFTSREKNIMRPYSSVKNRKKVEAITAFLMISPNMLGLLIFIFIPIAYSIYISFYKWDGLNERIFIGFQNYLNIFQDDVFFHSLLVSLKYVAIYVPAVFCLSLLLAVFVNSVRGRTQQIYRSTLFMSNTISTVVAALVWVFIYEPRRGYLNMFITSLGLDRQKFLGSPNTALLCVAIVGIWLVVGYDMVIFLASLKDIPRTYYEAANIDGAGPLRKFFNITFPLLKDTNIFILITTLIASLQVFDQIRVMTNGGPGSATNVTVLYIYKLAFERYNFGYASTAAVLLALVIMIVTSIQLRFYKIED